MSSPNSERIVYQFDIKLFQGHDNISPNDRPLAKVFETVVNYSKDWPTPIQKEIQTILLSIYHENQKQREGYQYSILSSLYKLANLLYQLPLKNKKTEKAALDSTLKNRETLFQIDTILDYIESNYLHAITIQDVADHVGFSPSYFSRFFKKYRDVFYQLSGRIPHPSGKVYFRNRAGSHGRSSCPLRFF
ncbi:AraC family transcriptional regulator [Enterococcus gallinarum]|nr:AraC family transcriptional regulator [Enterococcus gallinarum]MCW3744754.1 AraC family transcriptional regulator [Enterococcus gallinarum]